MINGGIQIAKNNFIPLYVQLKELIKEHIESGKYQPGDLIPSERELVEIYGISRSPVRQAINELVVEGLLRREHGKGTFVSKQKISQGFLENLSSFGDEMRLKGVPYTTTVLSKKVINSTSTLDGIFGSNTYSSYFRLERLRYVQGQPNVLVTTYVPCDFAPGLLSCDLENQSLYQTLETKFELNISHAERVIEAINASEEDAKMLGIEQMEAVQLTRTIAYLKNGLPFEYSIGRYRGDLNNFVVRVDYKKS